MRVIASGLRFPEGPVALENGDVALVEIERKTVTRVTAGGTTEVISQTGGGPNGLARGADGAFYVTNNGGFEFHHDEHGIRPTVEAKDYAGGRLERVDAATGEVRRLYDDIGNGHALRGPNDLVIDRDGGIWFTDLGKRRERDLDYGAIYYAAGDGSSIEEVIQPFISANGIGLSPDEKTLYVAETEGGRLWAFDIEAPGRVRKHPWPSPHGGRLVYTAGGSFQRYDSLAVEADGNICVATLMDGGISVISPSGDLVEFVVMPDRYTTNICFGGADMRTAYITLSQGGQLVAVEWPRPGLKPNFSGL
ncbi:MAG: SMP-30/gluconolactonase/LRE family protein [Geminicoccaceae bacterium]|nr:SMP-30/gluconolactonase/LRE family protein [Geminicoccaceae bacterium]